MRRYSAESCGPPHATTSAPIMGVHAPGPGELFEAHFRLPAKLLLCFGRVADETIDLGRANEARIDHDVGLVRAEPCCLERHAQKIANAVRLARCDDVVIRFVLLQHHPHRANIVAGESPIAMRVKVAETQLFR